ncbi:protein trichome birefringence-like 14 isoform X1 [Cucumis melo]|uniref:Protein trichome birefringence-like 14 isoform X1 n=1 Tax=Cucumis melo TaxID=3656 RepID=A0A1S3CBT7_CUCME|nr:protein trichome birefringence-like 14 isoform X1 [Cucumis melo]XP_008459940.1 protein trichome birefringence-like 14 isoform X1 [Cucumis melo]
MKKGFYGLRGKELSLVTIALMCMVIIMLTWEKTPLLNTIPPPQTRLQVSLDRGRLVSISPSGQQGHTSEYVPIFEDKNTVSNQEEARRPFSHSYSNEEDSVSSQSKGNHIGSGEATHKLVVELRNDGNSGSPKEIIEDETIHNQIVVKGKRAPIKKEVLKPKTKELDGKKEQAVEENYSSQAEQSVEENYSRQAEESVDSVSPIVYNISTIDEKLKKNQACDYAKGKWVVDEKQPSYSGFECKQWLSSMWACRLTQRTDFSYENLRWQPNNCEMERFEGSEFLKRMQGKTLAFVGDSLGRQQFQSLMCMVTGGKVQHFVDVGKEYNLILAPGNTRPSGWAYRFPSTNTTILYYWSASLCDVEPLDEKDGNTDYAMHLDRPPAFLQRYINKFDVLVLNTGHHWNRGKLKANRWVMHVDGKPNIDKKLAMIWSAKNFTIYSIVNWVNSQLPKYPGLKAFYRSISPRHFVGGDWNTGGSCDNTRPMSIGKEVSQYESSDESAAGAVKGTRVKILDITALSQLRDEAHISKYSITAKVGVQDCLHWCLPGVPDTWNEILFAQI